MNLFALDSSDIVIEMSRSPNNSVSGNRYETGESLRNSSKVKPKRTQMFHGIHR